MSAARHESSPESPVRTLEVDPQDPDGDLKDEIALCLSGGGYRAMVFHVGVLWRLNEAALLGKIDRVSSVSGGSITAAVLGMKWDLLGLSGGTGVAPDFVPHVVDPIRRLASRTIDEGSIIGGSLLPGVTVAEVVAKAYRKYLFGDKTLQDLPGRPRFVLNATNVQSGALWRFSKRYMWDWRVGKVEKPDVSLAVAVGASSAFPPVLSPVRLELDHDDFVPNSGHDLQKPPFTTDIVLSDGGVYDNLGLETAWKRCKTVFVSDAGGKMRPEAEPKSDWARHSLRVFDLVDNQVRNLRKRQVVQSYIDGRRNGAYWGIRTHIGDYKLPSALPCPAERTLDLAETPTRLKRMEDRLQERLINWGYAVCDAAIRKHHQPTPALPKGFPYPAVGV